MATNSRAEAFRVFTCFLRGTTSDAEIESAVRRLDFSSIQDLCDSLSLSRTELREIHLEAMKLSGKILLYLNGKLGRPVLLRWVDGLHAIVTSRSYPEVNPPVQGLAATLAVVSILLDAAALPGIRGCLEKVHGWLEEGKTVPLRRFLPRVFRDMGSLRLCVLENPLSFSSTSKEQWIDVGLCSTRAEGDAESQDDRGEGGLEEGPRESWCCRRTSMKIIPFSVFTRRFFKEELPAIISGISRVNESRPLDSATGDRFYYHPENNQAILLKERFPALRDGPVDFSYYVDEAGLAEIVIEAPAIDRELLRFAAGLFCLLNGVRRATLDGIRVPVHASSTEW